MGAIPELFRNRVGVVRSNHPTCSFAARGPRAAHVVAEQTLEDPFGEASPLATLYDLDASILLLGVGHERNTTLHLAERRAFGTLQKRVDTGTAILVDGARQWVTFSEPDVSPEDFGRLGADFEHETGLVRVAHVANARTRLFSVRDIVEFAIPWLRTHRAEAAG
jgi:aminoglycoside 3-N-acetyltransferase